MIPTSRNISTEKIEKVAKVLKTISHPVRLQIMEALELHEPLSVNAIKDQIEIEVEQSMLSHHLIKMRDNGILDSTKQGKQIFYTLVDRKILKIFDCMDKCDLF